MRLHTGIQIERKGTIVILWGLYKEWGTSRKELLRVNPEKHILKGCFDLLAEKPTDLRKAIPFMEN